MSDFGEYLADVAASGGDVSAPVPLHPGRPFRRFSRRRNFGGIVPPSTFTVVTAPGLAAEKESGDRRSQGKGPRADAAGGETILGKTQQKGNHEAQRPE
jgi:hypothetical protein